MRKADEKKPRYKMGKLGRKNTLVAYSFLAPNFLGFAFFTLIPVLCAIALSLFEWNGGGTTSAPKFIGLENYETIFAVKKVSEKGLEYFFNKVYLGQALKNTSLFTVITVPLTIVCALALAILLNKIKGAKFFRTVFFFPYVSSIVAICVCWRFMLMKNGPVNQILMSLGIDFNKPWTTSKEMVIWSFILVSVWRNMGYYMVLYLAALQGIPRELTEAATVDGANKWQQFLHVTLPQLKPTTFFVSVMLVISCFKIYDVVEIMTDGSITASNRMMVTYIYDTAFHTAKWKLGEASAISMVLLVIVLLVTIIQFSFEKKFSND